MKGCDEVGSREVAVDDGNGVLTTTGSAFARTGPAQICDVSRVSGSFWALEDETGLSLEGWVQFS